MLSGRGLEPLTTEEAWHAPLHQDSGQRVGSPGSPVMGRGSCPAQLQRHFHGWICSSPGTWLYFLVVLSRATVPFSVDSSLGLEGLLLGLHGIPLLPTVSGPRGTLESSSSARQVLIYGGKFKCSWHLPLPWKRGVWANRPQDTYLPVVTAIPTLPWSRSGFLGLRGTNQQQPLHLRMGDGCQKSCSPAPVGLGGQSTGCAFAGCRPYPPLHNTPHLSLAPHAPSVELQDWDPPQE